MSSSWIPCEATIRPGAPLRIRGLRAPSSNGPSQPASSSAPPSMSASARFIATIWLGRASTKWGSSVGLAIVVTVTRSPPISEARDPYSEVVATTLRAAVAGAAAPAAQARAAAQAANGCRRGDFMAVSSLLELVGGVRPEQEFELEPKGVFVLPRGIEMVEV